MPKMRWTMIVLCFLATTINYVDRATMSVAAPFMQRELGLTPATMGFLLGRFLLDLRRDAATGRMARGSARPALHLRVCRVVVVALHGTDLSRERRRSHLRVAPRPRDRRSRQLSGQRRRRGALVSTRRAGDRGGHLRLGVARRHGACHCRSWRRSSLSWAGVGLSWPRASSAWSGPRPGFSSTAIPSGILRSTPPRWRVSGQPSPSRLRPARCRGVLCSGTAPCGG